MGREHCTAHVTGWDGQDGPSMGSVRRFDVLERTRGLRIVNVTKHEGGSSFSRDRNGFYRDEYSFVPGPASRWLDAMRTHPEETAFWVCYATDAFDYEVNEQMVAQIVRE